MEEALQDEVQKLVEHLKPNVGKSMSLNRVANISILNALWYILVGERLDLGNTKLDKLVQAFDDLLKLSEGPTSITVSLLPHSSMALWPGLKTFTGMNYVETAFNSITEFILPYVKDHKESLDDDNIRDFMDLMLLEVKNCKDVNSSFHGYRGEAALINNMIDLFIAGMETTSSSLLWAILYLLHFPDMKKRIHAEIDEVTGGNRPPALEDRPAMHYTNAFLLESFRMTSFVPMSVFHYSSAEVRIKDYVIPKDCIVIGSLYHVMHDPNYFKNPEVFQPERFLDYGKFVNDERVIPFSIGKRFCLGKSLAEKEFFLFFAGLLHSYDIKQVPGTMLPGFGIEDQPVQGLVRSAPDYKVQLFARN
jgi:cytochrome P450